MLRASACGFGTLALADLLKADTARAANPLAPKAPPLPAKARRVIFLFMAGGPSHVDLFDPKPRLNELDGQKIPPELLKNHQQFALIRGTPSLKGSRRKFSRHGRSGMVLSDWLPHLAGVGLYFYVHNKVEFDQYFGGK